MSLGKNGKNKKNKIDFNPMYNYLKKTKHLKQHRSPFQSNCQYIDGETFLVLISIFLNTVFMIRTTKKLPQFTFTLPGNLWHMKVFQFLSRFRERGKGKRFLILFLRGPQQYKQRNKLVSGNRKSLLKSLSSLRQTTEPRVVILNTCCLGSNFMLLT